MRGAELVSASSHTCSHTRSHEHAHPHAQTLRGPRRHPLKHTLRVLHSKLVTLLVDITKLIFNTGFINLH